MLVLCAYHQAPEVVSRTKKYCASKIYLHSYIVAINLDPPQ